MAHGNTAGPVQQQQRTRKETILTLQIHQFAIEGIKKQNKPVIETEEEREMDRLRVFTSQFLNTKTNN